ncbi:MAG: hypothetical protein Tsb0034_24310 [Ekhidna sp.]
MSDTPENQIQDWLKKLERESWQLELLVSAFTIFLLIGANSAYADFLREIPYRVNTTGPTLAIGMIFLLVIKNSIMALTVSLIVHLMLRGFWIGTIGLRSVQAEIDFEKLKYNAFFTEKLRKKVISLDRMVVILDEICSVIFAFSFLIISILVAFGMYLVVVGLLGIGLGFLLEWLAGTMATIALVTIIILILIYLFMGLIYMIDYLSLGFFKKIRWFSKIYYPFYRFFSFITLAGLSRSIYYYLISKFSKNSIRAVYSSIAGLYLVFFLFDFDHFPYYPEADTRLEVSPNVYDNRRPADDYVHTISIPSDYIDKPFFPIFLRYNAEDNELIQAQCPNFEPIKSEGFNTRMEVRSSKGNFQIRGKDHSREDFEKLLACHSAIYQVAINDSVYHDLTYHFYTHPARDQRGLLTVIPTDGFIIGENMLTIKKKGAEDPEETIEYVSIPFWYFPN